MAVNLTRRAASVSDAGQVLAWFDSRWQAASWGGVVAPSPLTADWIADEFGKADYWVWVDDNSNLCGIFGLAQMDDVARIMRFAVAPRLRGQGLGTALFAEILALAAATGATEASLGIFGSNTIAKSIYEQAGFQVVGERQADIDPTAISYEMRTRLRPK
jgi:ribosomal protein S18 acetylase RimI-like enzyme